MSERSIDDSYNDFIASMFHAFGVCRVSSDIEQIRGIANNLMACVFKIHRSMEEAMDESLSKAESASELSALMDFQDRFNALMSKHDDDTNRLDSDS